MNIKQVVGRIILSGLVLLLGCAPEENDHTLFTQFQNPAAESRPMVRWWWNGNSVEAGEIKRELGLMKKAGIGGVEINPIAMPPFALQQDKKPLQWAGEEWSKMVKTASEEARELGMITDLIVGSGWPFGGRFLKEDETMQRLGIKKYSVKANSSINLDLQSELSFQRKHSPGAKQMPEKSKVELLSAKLIPEKTKGLAEIIDLTREVKDNRLVHTTDDQDYVLVLVYNERDFKSVYHGAPGADGPIMDHYKTEVVMGYLDRLKAIEAATGIPLSDLIRALFCDSIELGGSNWTDDMDMQFLHHNGYDITPYLPFVIQPHGKPNTYSTSEEFADILKRVQYDFYNTLISLFLERFTSTFQEFCTENGVLCRYQAYGTPYYMGLFQGNMIPDIPESNNWIYSRGRDEAAESAFTWVQDHGYMLWNKAASSGAHIMGRKITSCESMTNVRGVFKTSLETVKQADDMNFITGINHTVLHGYNYSPPEAGFPGWIRYGAYFSEQNTWWKYFNNWADYNARLSSVFQHSEPKVDIAVLGPLGDLWGEVGAERSALNNKPWYYARLWEPISQLGSSCDYIHMPVLESSRIEGKQLICGKMSYKSLILADVESLSPEAALKIEEFALAGGKLVFVGNLPRRSLSYIDSEKNDKIVSLAIDFASGAEHAVQLASPDRSGDFMAWTRGLMEEIELAPQVVISDPKSQLYFMKQTRGEQEIYFFVNSDRESALEFEATFKTGKKMPYLWLPATGERFSLSSKKKNKLNIKLDALESALIVYEPAKIELPEYFFNTAPGQGTPLNSSWKVKFEHINGTVFKQDMDQLIDFKTSEEEKIRTFAGTVSYSIELENSGTIKHIKLGDVNEAVSELLVNGHPAGLKWYGNHSYDVGRFIKEGTNQIEVRLTTTLANYCASLTDNPVAQQWASYYPTPLSSGLCSVEIFE